MLETINFYKYLIQKLRNLASSMRNNSNTSSSSSGVSISRQVIQYIKDLEDISSLVSSRLADLYEFSKTDAYLKSNSLYTNASANTAKSDNSTNEIEIESELNVALRDINLKLDNLLSTSANRISYHLNDLNIKLDSLIASDKKMKDKNKQ